MALLLKWLKNRYVQLLVALFVGGAVATVLYPTKTVEERTKAVMVLEFKERYIELMEEHSQKTESLTAKYALDVKSRIESNEELSSKVTSLTTEVTDLKSKTKESFYKLIKPDGTIVEKRYKESELESHSEVVTEIREEFNRKVSTIESRWKSVYKSRLIEVKETFDKKLKKEKEKWEKSKQTVETEKITKTNPKSFGLEGGIDTDKDLYLHGTYNLYGPFFMGGHVGLDDKQVPDAGGFGIGVDF